VANLDTRGSVAQIQWDAMKCPQSESLGLRVGIPITSYGAGSLQGPELEDFPRSLTPSSLLISPVWNPGAPYVFSIQDRTDLLGARSLTCSV
jgi:hypothetical protein